MPQPSAKPPRLPQRPAPEAALTPIPAHTMHPARPGGRMLRGAALAGMAWLLAACTPAVRPAGPPITAPALHEGQMVEGVSQGASLTMADGARLPLHIWMPKAPPAPVITGTAPDAAEEQDKAPTAPIGPNAAGHSPSPDSPNTRVEAEAASESVGPEPKAIILALHGFNDTAENFLYLAAPQLAQAGMAVYAYDQRGFGGAPHHGIWPGSAALVSDVTATAALLRARWPGKPLILMGESMGGAALVLAASSPHPPTADAYVLLAPALWAPGTLPKPARWFLWLAAHTMPIVSLSGDSAGVRASDNDAALRRWGSDPLTIKDTRIDSIYGLVPMMNQAFGALPGCCHAAAAAGDAVSAPRAPTLLLYGGHDQLVPGKSMHAALAQPGVLEHLRFGFYPPGYHLLLRDSIRAEVMRDVLAFIADPAAPLPSGAEAAGQAWFKNPTPAKKAGAGHTGGR